jgi:pyruvate dehydrogenase E2 component (dihydrolipoamide acetyltransferase)
MPDVVMPRLSDSMEEGTILRWLKSVGDEVSTGDELVEIETDKANMVYEADEAGTLSEIVAGEGETLPIGEVIAKVGEGEPSTDGAGGDETDAEAEGGDQAEAGEGDGGEGGGAEDRDQAEEGRDEAEAEGGGGARLRDPASSDGGEGADGTGTATVPTTSPAPAPQDQAAEGTAATPQAAPAAGDGAPAGGDGRVKASPLARRMAEEKGLDLGGLSGSGPGGRIVKADVEQAASEGTQAKEPAAQAESAAPAAQPQAAASPTPGAREKPETAKGETQQVELSKLQQTVARRMAESKATAPHFYLQAEIDMTAAVSGRARLKQIAGEDDPVPTFNDMVIKACGLALREHPRANGAYRDGRIEHYSRVNVGVAVAAQDALVVPTVFDADRKGLRQIAAETKALAARVREGTITPPELSGATFTVSNLGMYGISNFHAVINPPQAAILAVGELKAKPVVAESGEIEPRQLMGVTLACDHRILYGADGAIFLRRVRELLEDPIGLAL